MSRHAKRTCCCTETDSYLIYIIVLLVLAQAIARLEIYFLDSCGIRYDIHAGAGWPEHFLSFIILRSRWLYRLIYYTFMFGFLFLTTDEMIVRLTSLLLGADYATTYSWLLNPYCRSVLALATMVIAKCGLRPLRRMVAPLKRLFGQYIVSIF